MKRILLAIVIALLSLNANAGRGVGLVLSGGGAKGVAHVGVIQALEENDIPIDYIAGTSMGAIIGSLYAAGYTPAEMMELLASPTFVNASTGTMDPKELYLFYRPDASPTFFNMTASVKDSIHINSILPASLISPMPMNFAFMQIYAPATAACKGNFDQLFVPFRCVASDMKAQQKLVWREGPLEDAVRSSMTFPIVFHPVEHDGSLLYDGGIYDNFPVDVMREDFDPEIMIGVDVHASDADNSTFPNIMSQMDILVMRPSNYDLPEDEGIYMRVNLNKFSLLDFPKSPEIYQIGYDRAMEMMDSIKSRVKARVPAEEVARRREQFHNRQHDVTFESINVRGGTAQENDYVKSLFTPEHGATTLGLDKAFDAYSSAYSTSMLLNIEPQAKLNPSTGMFDLNVRLSPKGQFGFGIGGYITSSSNSMLYLQATHNSLSFKAFDASLGAWLGQNYMAGALKTRYIFRSDNPMAATMLLVAQRQRFYESDKLFYDTDSPAFISHTEMFGRLSWSIATARSAKFDIGAGFGHLRDSYYDNDYKDLTDNIDKNLLRQNLGQAMLRWEFNTLDDEVLPTSGRSIKAMGQGVMGRYNLMPGMLPDSDEAPTTIKHNTKYIGLEVDYRDFFPIGSKVAFGIESTLVASTQKLISESYNASMVNATPFRPTAVSYNVFNPNMRANSFITAGIVPVYKFSDRFSARGSFHAFVPWRPIECGPDATAHYGKWFSKADFYGELAAVVKLPFAALSVYGNYQTIPGNRWGVGVSFGVFILAPRFLRP